MQMAGKHGTLCKFSQNLHQEMIDAGITAGLGRVMKYAKYASNDLFIMIETEKLHVWWSFQTGYSATGSCG